MTGRKMMEARRPVWQRLRYWKEIVEGGRFPGGDEIDRWLQGEDGANCLLNSVGWSVEFLDLTDPSRPTTGRE